MSSLVSDYKKCMPSNFLSTLKCQLTKYAKQFIITIQIYELHSWCAQLSLSGCHRYTMPPHEAQASGSQNAACGEKKQVWVSKVSS